MHYHTVYKVGNPLPSSHFAKRNLDQSKWKNQRYKNLNPKYPVKHREQRPKRLSKQDIILRKIATYAVYTLIIPSPSIQVGSNDTPIDYNFRA